MKQMSLFEEKKEIVSEPVITPVNTCPDADGEHKKILGVRYSLTEVKDWIEVYGFCISRPPEKYDIEGVTSHYQTVWIDPSTIKKALKNHTGNAWGFGPSFDVSRYIYERVSFHFKNYDDCDRVKCIN